MKEVIDYDTKLTKTQKALYMRMKAVAPVIGEFFWYKIPNVSMRDANVLIDAGLIMVRTFGVKGKARMMLTSDLTFSDIDKPRTKARKMRLDHAHSCIVTATAEYRALRDECVNQLESMPVNLLGSRTADQIECCIDNLNECLTYLEQAASIKPVFPRWRP